MDDNVKDKEAPCGEGDVAYSNYNWTARGKLNWDYRDEEWKKRLVGWPSKHYWHPHKKPKTGLKDVIERVGSFIAESIKMDKVNLEEYLDKKSIRKTEDTYQIGKMRIDKVLEKYYYELRDSSIEIKNISDITRIHTALFESCYAIDSKGRSLEEDFLITMDKCIR